MGSRHWRFFLPNINSKYTLNILLTKAILFKWPILEIQTENIFVDYSKYNLNSILIFLRECILAPIAIYNIWYTLIMGFLPERIDLSLVNRFSNYNNYNKMQPQTKDDPSSTDETWLKFAVGDLPLNQKHHGCDVSLSFLLQYLGIINFFYFFLLPSQN